MSYSKHTPDWVPPLIQSLQQLHMAYRTHSKPHHGVWVLCEVTLDLSRLFCLKPQDDALRSAIAKCMQLHAHPPYRFSSLPLFLLCSLPGQLSLPTTPGIATHMVRLLHRRQGVTSARKLLLDPKLGSGVPSCSFHTTQSISLYSRRWFTITC